MRFKTMRTKQALASALICGLALGFNASANVVYDQEVTNAWFSVTAANANLSDAKHWSQLKDGTAVVDGKVIKLDTDFDDPLTYTPDERSGGISIVSAKLEATANASEPTFTDTPQAALMVRITDDGVATNWYGLVGGSEGSTWMKFENIIPTVGETYDIKIEFDLRESANNIRYSVGGTILGTGWYDNPKTKTGVGSIGAVSFAGTGDVGDFDGKNVSEAAASFNGVNYTNFDAALNAAKASGSWSAATPVVLYKDAEYEASATEKLYIDANSCDFTIKGDVAVDWNGTECSITAGGECEAKIGEVFYSTIEKAIEAAGANQTITVNKELNKEVLTFNTVSVMTLDTNGKSVTCATLTVAQGVTLTLAKALAVTDANVAGSVAGAALTVNGTLTGTAVGTLTFGDSAIFAYNSAPLAATTLTVGARLTISGLDSVQLGDVIINDIGEADVLKFVAQTAMPEGLTLGKDGIALKVVKAAPDVEIELDEDTAGYDFTNGTVSVTATVQSGKSGSLVLKYIDFDSGTEKVLGKQTISETGTVKWDLSDLMPGGTYSYVIEVSDSADKVIDTKYGTFTAANWADDVWFGADASSGVDDRKNGSWAGGVAPKIDNGAYVIDENSVFDVTDASAGSNRVARVDVSVLFDSMTDVETLTVESGALGGFLAAAKGDGGVWMALTVANGEPTWVELTGAVAPEVNKPYVVRAEVSFLAKKKKVRYLVSDDDGKNFFVLADENSKQWLALADDTKGTLARLELRGEGKVVKFTAKVSDRALAEVDGVKYVELADALAAARDKSDKQVKLLTNVTLTPAAAGTYRIDKNGHAFELKLPTGWTGEWDEATGTLTVEEPVSGATYLIW